jgi:hypothetical protein
MEPGARLQEHFRKLSKDQQVEGWEHAWQTSLTPWDRQGPNPALNDALTRKKDILGSPLQDEATKKRKKVLVSESLQPCFS